jgi:uncharacterized membrane protein
MKMIKNDMRITEKLDMESFKMMIGLCGFYAMTISVIFAAIAWPWTLFFTIPLFIIIWIVFAYRMERMHKINETMTFLNKIRSRQDEDDENDEE